VEISYISRSFNRRAAHLGLRVTRINHSSGWVARDLAGAIYLFFKKNDSLQFLWATMSHHGRHFSAGK
jgi:hypothetical protein